MKATRFPSITLSICLIVALALPASASPSGSPRVVGTDPAGDWSDTIAAGLGPAGDALGQDLVKASIGSTKKTLDFVIQVTKLPAGDVATVPTGYMWDFKVNGIWYEINTCEPDLAPSCPQPPVGTMPFMVFQCLNILTTGCQLVAGVSAELDAKTNSIIVRVPRKAVMAQTDSIVQGYAAFGSMVYSYVGIPVAGNTDGPGDQLTTTKIYMVP